VTEDETTDEVPSLPIASSTDVAPSSLVVRSVVEPVEHYDEYRQVLRFDFFYSCAYCTMTESEARGIRFTIDHYEPQSARRDLVNEYSNLLYACDTCNIRKGNRCPSPEVVCSLKADPG
jgi:HNH endonuclease